MNRAAAESYAGTFNGGSEPYPLPLMKPDTASEKKAVSGRMETALADLGRIRGFGGGGGNTEAGSWEGATRLMRGEAMESKVDPSSRSRN